MTEAQTPSSQPNRIVLGVTGGIAAYKTAELVRRLTREGYDVVPIMTPWATRFLGPLTLEALTGHTVRVETPAQEDKDGIEHISLIRSARLLLVAPLTANTAAKMAAGMADNFLTATYLAHRGLTAGCPAMNTAMLEHPATRRNLAQLEADGVSLCYGEAGDLACGEVGAGRMAEPEVIVDFVENLLAHKHPELAGKQVLVTGGPTQEVLDPVRYLTNRSSGKMGFAVAKAFRNGGANVTLVHGPTNLQVPRGITAVTVRSAEDMAQAVLTRAETMDVIVKSAAVADYRPPMSGQKLKKGNFDGVLRLERTTDILATLGGRKTSNQVLAGFAAESENVIANARDKLARKNLDFIFANDISSTEIGFGTAENRIMAICADGRDLDLGRQSKDKLAEEMVSLIADHLRKQ